MMSDPRESLPPAPAPAPAPALAPAPGEVGAPGSSASAPAGESRWESTLEAPDEWTPHVWPYDVPPAPRSRRGLAAAAFACGALGLLIAVFGVWGSLLSLAAVLMALAARLGDHAVGNLWRWALATGLIGLVLSMLWVLLITGALPMPGT